MQKIAMFFSVFILMILLVFSNIIPAWASLSFNPVNKVAISETYTAISSTNPIKNHLIIFKKKKIVCRYVDGRKRCWDP